MDRNHLPNKNKIKKPINNNQNKDRLPLVKKSQNIKASVNSNKGKGNVRKETLVYRVLKRWWYAVGQWPPADYDVMPKLKERELFLVDKELWKVTPNVNENGMNKCCECDGFKFVYIDYLGKTHDLRPEENRPSFNNFYKKVKNFIIFVIFFLFLNFLLKFLLLFLL